MREIVLFTFRTKRGARQSGASRGDEAVSGVRQVGAELAAARERLGWTLPDIAGHLRIRKPYLAAIEQGRLDELPGSAYAMGFVRAYAKALGLPPDDVARRFRDEVAEVDRKPELAFPAPVPERGVPAGAVVMLGAVLAVGAYVGWYKASGEKPGLEPVRQVPERLAGLASPPAAPVVPPATSPATSSAAVQPSQNPILSPLPVIPPSSAAAAVVPNAVSQALTVQPAPAQPGLSALPDGTRIVLRAKAEAWIQVRDRQGQVLLNRVLRPGETWPVPGKLALLLTTGNAGGTELLVDGVLSPSLGADGAVRRDLALDADAIRDGKLAPIAAATPPATPGPAPARPATPAVRTP